MSQHRSSDPDLRPVFRPAASSVWVVTTVDAGRPVGFTAISVVSVSMRPPLLSFNVTRTSSSLGGLTASGRFAAHLLRADQHETAGRFSRAAAQRFADPATWAWAADGLPALVDVLARASGDVDRLVDAGDSVLVLGRVRHVEAPASELGPLLNHERHFLPVPRRAAVSWAPATDPA